MPTMRATTLLVVMLMVTGCAQHTPPDAVVVGELHAAVLATFDAMALPAAEQPAGRELDTRMESLALHADQARVKAIHDGTLTPERLRDAYRATMRRRDQRHDAAAPPRLLTYLDQHASTWTPAQSVLFDALLRQYQSEEGLAEGPTELSTGAR